MSSSSVDLTRILNECGTGDPAALDQLVPIIYKELRRLASSQLKRERYDHTLQPTALVHEAYIRLLGQADISWQNRNQFFAVAARMMRRVLIDYARTRSRDKRGGGARKVSLEEAVNLSEESAADLVALDEALKDLHELYPRKSQVVELRYFGGLGIEEVAESLGISKNTVLRDWEFAKAWLYQKLKAGE